MYLVARLRAFAGFVRRGSFSAAATDLRISQPAVSRQIAELERDLGVELIERRSRRLTAAGEFVASHVLRAEAILAQAATGVAALREPASGSLAICASGTPGTYVLPKVIAEFHQRHPGIRISFSLGTAKEVVQAVRSHKAELGVVGAFVAAPEIEAEHLIDDDIVVVGPRSFGQKRLSRELLESLTWIAREEGSGTSALADAALADIGISTNKRLVLPSWEAIKLAVRAGYGIAAFSRLAVAEELASGTLVLLPILPWKIRRAFSTIRIRDAAPSPAAEQFLIALRRDCAKSAPRQQKQDRSRPRNPRKRGFVSAAGRNRS
jgi:DNA-binding transcriptional LysR family regulator